jgi:hypothetical protein
MDRFEQVKNQFRTSELATELEYPFPAQPSERDTLSDTKRKATTSDMHENNISKMRKLTAKGDESPDLAAMDEGGPGPATLASNQSESSYKPPNVWQIEFRELEDDSNVVFDEISWGDAMSQGSSEHKPNSDDAMWEIDVADVGSEYGRSVTADRPMYEKDSEHSGCVKPALSNPDANEAYH